MKYNCTMDKNLQYRITRVNIYTYFPQIYFHMKQLTLSMHIFELFTITFSFTIAQINENRDLQ